MQLAITIGTWSEISSHATSTRALLRRGKRLKVVRRVSCERPKRRESAVLRANKMKSSFRSAIHCGERSRVAILPALRWESVAGQDGVANACACCNCGTGRVILNGLHFLSQCFVLDGIAKPIRIVMAS